MGRHSAQLNGLAGLIGGCPWVVASLNTVSVTSSSRLEVPGKNKIFLSGQYKVGLFPLPSTCSYSEKMK